MKTLIGSYSQFSRSLQLILLPKQIIGPFVSFLRKRYPNMSHAITKIQRLLIPSLLYEQFQSFMEFPSFSTHVARKCQD